MHWSQTYSPVGGLGLSAFLATLPIVTLLGLLAFFHVRAQIAALAGLIVALALAIAVYGMPAPLALLAAGYGAAYGLFPIGWIIINAIFVYNLSVRLLVVEHPVLGVGDDVLLLDALDGRGGELVAEVGVGSRQVLEIAPALRHAFAG